MKTHTTHLLPPLRLNLGMIVLTPGAIQAIAGQQELPEPYLQRHEHGDWGDLDEEDKQRNNEAVAHEGDPDRQERVLSAYHTKQGIKIWIITEADRSVTTVLLPEEY